MIELRNVVKEYGGRRVVDDVSLEVPRGQLCVLLGRSGSGKSTALRLINRLIEPTAGTVLIDGRAVAEGSAEVLRRRIGYVIQSSGLFPHWTVADNVATVPKLLGWPTEKVGQRVAELMHLVQLPAEHLQKYPHELSGGQQQRVGVARALAAKPDVLLMDEPFGALDPLTREALRSEFKRIQRSTGVTAIVVTHDVDEALILADLVGILDGGRLLQFGPPREILERPASDLVRRFLGEASMGLNLLAVRRVGDHVRSGEQATGEPIAADASLRDAVSRMVERRTGELPVQDENGGIAGAIRWTDIVK